MNKIVFQVEFLSDIILQASSNTQGNIEQLDFIPGSNFLGMVAKDYGKFENSFDVFHSGKVKFGDATILKDDKVTYKVPLSYFYRKLDKDVNKTLYNHHLLTDDEFKSLGQLKQKRNGYITKDLEPIEIDYNYSQKSAYDKEKRRSLDSSMYGYSAIKSGTKWQFAITYDESIENIKDIISSLVGTKRLGKSKSAQYGLVKITQQGTIQDVEETNSNEIILYANSRIALFDNEGNATYDLKYLFNDIKEENIIYDKCQIKTSIFTPYNSKRETKDYERVCINKGSVIVLKNIDRSIIPNFVGTYQSEGFGEILINPSFLMAKEFEFKEINKNKENKENIVIKSDLAKFLQKREDDKQNKLNILNIVDKFIKDNKTLSKKKMNSQWGQIRSICQNSTDDTIYENIKEYITHGVAKVKWEGRNEKIILEGIKKSDQKLKFTKLLSILIPKQKEESKND
jgi:hypothetical protein